MMSKNNKIVSEYNHNNSSNWDDEITDVVSVQISNSNFPQPKFPKNNTNTKKHSSKKHTNVSSDSDSDSELDVVDREPPIAVSYIHPLMAVDEKKTMSKKYA